MVVDNLLNVLLVNYLVDLENALISRLLKLYTSMILPTLTYCGILQLKLTTSQNNKLLSFHDRAVKTISLGCNLESEVKLPSVINSNNKSACLLIHQCIDKDIGPIFNNYFTVLNHEKGTRNDEFTLRLPKIRTEYANLFRLWVLKCTTPCQLRFEKNPQKRILKNC